MGTNRKEMPMMLCLSSTNVNPLHLSWNESHFTVTCLRNWSIFSLTASSYLNLLLFGLSSEQFFDLNHFSSRTRIYGILANQKTCTFAPWMVLSRHCWGASEYAAAARGSMKLRASDSSKSAEAQHRSASAARMRRIWKCKEFLAKGQYEQRQVYTQEHWDRYSIGGEKGKVRKSFVDEYWEVEIKISSGSRGEATDHRVHVLCETVKARRWIIRALRAFILEIHPRW